MDPIAAKFTLLGEASAINNYAAPLDHALLCGFGTPVWRPQNASSVAQKMTASAMRFGHGQNDPMGEALLQDGKFA
jgi:hypothetical protein